MNFSTSVLVACREATDGSGRNADIYVSTSPGNASSAGGATGSSEKIIAIECAVFWT
jgi:hypothetical protein